MNVCFVGYGSIAKRHIGNLQQLLSTGPHDLRIDLLRTNASECPPGIACVHTSTETLKKPYDAIFITNPTALHYKTLQSLMPYSDAFFVEKPVFDKCDYDLSFLDKQTDKVFYVACPLRYHPVIQWLKDNYDFSHALSLRCISSSYLPDWRPGIDYRQTYSAHKALGGGVSIDLIHEWDYLQYLIGPPLSVKAVIGKMSNLEIDSDDIALYLAEYGSKTVELHLDYFGRVPIRKLEIIGEEDTLVGDLVAGTLTFLREGEVMVFESERNGFQEKELLHFLRIVSKCIPNDSGIENAVRTLKLAKGEI